MDHFRTSCHKTFSLSQWVSTSLVFANPRVYSNKSLVWKRRDPESFMAPLPMQRKPIWVCMSPLISTICIITSKSSFSAFHGSLSFVSDGIQFVPWRMSCLCLVLLWCPCPPLPGRCWGISTCLLVGVLELRVTAGACSSTASLQSGFSWCSLLGKAEPRGKHDHSGFGSQTGECL